MMHSMYKITRILVILVMRYVLGTMILLKSESTYVLTLSSLLNVPYNQHFKAPKP